MAQASDQTLERLNRLIEQRISDSGNDIMGGSCKTFEEYRNRVGFMDGLLWVQRELLELSERIVKE